MNRFKKELRKRGYQLECDYPYLPFDGIETVRVISEVAMIAICHVSAGWVYIPFGRDFREVE